MDNVSYLTLALLCFGFGYFYIFQDVGPSDGDISRSHKIQNGPPDHTRAFQTGEADPAVLKWAQQAGIDASDPYLKPELRAILAPEKRTPIPLPAGRHDGRTYNAPSHLSRPVVSAPNNSEMPAADIRKLWSATSGKFDNAVNLIGSYEIDPQKAIDYPAFNDVRVPATSAMIQKLKQATRAKDLGNLAQTPKIERLEQFMEAVDELLLSIEFAERNAHNVRWNNLTQKEQKDLGLAQNLLKQAANPGNPQEVRANFARKLQDVIRRLNETHGAVLIPGKALLEISASASRELKSLHSQSVGAIEPNNDGLQDGTTQNAQESVFSLDAVVEVPDFPVSYTDAQDTIAKFADENKNLMKRGGNVVLSFQYALVDMMSDSFVEGLTRAINMHPSTNWLLSHIEPETVSRLIDKSPNLKVVDTSLLSKPSA